MHLNVAKKVKLEIVLANSLLHVFNFQATLWLCGAIWVLTTFWQRSGHNFCVAPCCSCLLLWFCFLTFPSFGNYNIIIRWLGGYHSQDNYHGYTLPLHGWSSWLHQTFGHLPQAHFCWWVVEPITFISRKGVFPCPTY